MKEISLVLKDNDWTGIIKVILEYTTAQGDEPTHVCQK